MTRLSARSGYRLLRVAAPDDHERMRRRLPMANDTTGRAGAGADVDAPVHGSAA